MFICFSCLDGELKDSYIIKGLQFAIGGLTPMLINLYFIIYAIYLQHVMSTAALQVPVINMEMEHVTDHAKLAMGLTQTAIVKASVLHKSFS